MGNVTHTVSDFICFYFGVLMLGKDRTRFRAGFSLPVHPYLYIPYNKKVEFSLAHSLKTLPKVTFFQVSAGRLLL